MTEQREAIMADLEIKSFDKPDETRRFEDKGTIDVVVLAGRPVGRAVFEPGWKWSQHVKPIAGTDRCEVSHIGYCMAGRMRLYMSDGRQQAGSGGRI
jgi:hypothetical protein